MDRVFRIDSWSRRTAAPSYDMLMVRDCTYSRLYAGGGGRDADADDDIPMTTMRRAVHVSSNALGVFGGNNKEIKTDAIKMYVSRPHFFLILL
jgi:hypothetical protein